MPNYMIIASGGITTDLNDDTHENLQVLDYSIECLNASCAFSIFKRANKGVLKQFENFKIVEVYQVHTPKQ
jgi:hypothetical protein